MPIRWDIPPDLAMMRLTSDVMVALDRKLKALCRKYAKEIRLYMQTTRRWTDRTGNLRRTLIGEYEVFGDLYRLSWDYALWYGGELEHRPDLWERYAVIAPTYDVYVPRIFAELDRLLNEL